MLSFIYNCLLIFLLCYSHSLLDGRINNVLSLCHDPAILSSVHSIIRNMVACEDANQQQLHYLQSCGFGGLWRFAGPFTKVGLFFTYFHSSFFLGFHNVHKLILDFTETGSSRYYSLKTVQNRTKQCF